jgi:membrane protein YdbS with pleckstrin-like domain
MMTIEKTRAQITGAIWQAFAQTEADLAALPREEQEKLVKEIADQVMIAMDRILDDVPRPEIAEEGGDEFDEQEIWEGRPFLSLVESYVITSERVKIVRGMFSRDIENFELIRVQDIDLKQGVNERLLGIGDITIRGHDSSDPQIVLRNVSKPEDVYELLRRAWLDARKRHGLQFREFM